MFNYSAISGEYYDIHAVTIPPSPLPPLNPLPSHIARQQVCLHDERLCKQRYPSTQQAAR